MGLTQKFVAPKDPFTFAPGNRGFWLKALRSMSDETRRLTIAWAQRMEDEIGYGEYTEERVTRAIPEGLAGVELELAIHALVESWVHGSSLNDWRDARQLNK